MFSKIALHPHFLPWFLFIIFTCIYFASGNGGINSGDGSSYSLTKALVEDKTIQIDNSIQWTYFVDYGQSNGHYYLDREPGLSFLGTPFYVMGKILSPITFNPYPGINGRLSAETRLQLLTYITNAFFGAAAVVFIYLISLQLSGSKKASFITAVSTGLGTLLWKYSSSYFREPVFTALLLGSLYLLLFAKGKILFLSGLLLGLALFVDYSKFYIFFIIAGYSMIVGMYLDNKKTGGVSEGFPKVASLGLTGEGLTTERVPLKRSASWRMGYLSGKTHLAYFLAGIAIPLLFIFSYNFLAFGNPFANPHLHKSHFAWMSNSSTLFQIPLFAGMLTNLINNGPIQKDLLSFFSSHPEIYKQFAVELYHTWNYKGVLMQTPLLITAIAGWILLVKKKKRASFLLLSVSIAIFTVTSKLSLFWAGINQDGRYFIPVTVIWLIGLCGWINFVEKIGNLVIKNVFIFLTIVLLFLSVYNGWYSSITQFAPGNTGFYRFTLSQLKYPFFSHLSVNLTLIISHTFPNLINLYIMPVYFFVFFAIYKFIHKVARIYFT